MLPQQIISENRQERLLDWINQIENDLNNLFHNVEDDTDIKEESFHLIEKSIESLFVKLNAMREEIY
jgi:hypothetical protein